MGATELIGVINYNIGTWTSVVNMLDAIGVRAVSCSNPDELSEFSHIVLPGVGNFYTASEQLDRLGWREPIKEIIKSGTPTLGICLGMQLLGQSSEESEGNGLGVLDFRSELLSNEGPFRVPHMGWNSVQDLSNHSIFDGWRPDSRFYFVHSFAVPVGSPDAIGHTNHNQLFTSIVAKENVVGVQFHPEKSRDYGRKLLENFVEM
jgi:glutamine amidotransferase